MSKPLFFSSLNEFINSIPPITHGRSLIDNVIENDKKAPPLLRNYLDFYQIQYPELAAAYSIGKSRIEGFSIVEHYWQARVHNAKTLYLSHGFLDHTGVYGRLIEWGLRQGYNVHGIDFPGHGLSSGKRAAIDSFDQYSAILAQVLKRQGESDFILLGQSTGSAVVANYLLKPQQYTPQAPPQKVVLMAPLVRSQGWHVMRWPFYLARHFIRSVRRSFRACSHNQVSADFIRHKDPLQSKRIPVSWVMAMDDWYKQMRQDNHAHLNPFTALEVLIIQGDGDRVVDYAYNLERLQHFFPKTCTTLIKDAEHRLVNESDEYWQLIEKGLNDYCQR